MKLPFKPYTGYVSFSKEKGFHGNEFDEKSAKQVECDSDESPVDMNDFHVVQDNAVGRQEIQNETVLQTDEQAERLDLTIYMKTNNIVNELDSIREIQNETFDDAETVSCLSKTETQGSDWKKCFKLKRKKNKSFVGIDHKLRIPTTIEYRYTIKKIEAHRWINKELQDIQYLVEWENIKGIKKFKK
jgi:hypothetical protein